MEKEQTKKNTDNEREMENREVQERKNIYINKRGELEIRNRKKERK